MFSDVSCLVAMEHFNIVKSVGVEYMHCVLLGVQKGLIDLFCNTQNSNQKFYIANKDRKLLNGRIVALKPNSEIVRKPRSLAHRSDFKASEFRSMLLYYLPICLPGCMPDEFVKHVRLLSAAVYILLKSTITRQEIDEAEKMLFRFVGQHQKLFGKQNMVMNVHLLKHLVDDVRELGPLWCHSAFPFERNNGVLLKKVNGTTDVLLQISSKYCLSKSVINHRINNRNGKSNDGENVSLLGRSVLVTEKSLRAFSIESLKEVNLSNKALYVHKRIKLNNVIYTSTLYTLPKKSIDYFIGLESGMIGKAKYYFKSNGNTYVLMEEFDTVDDIGHISTVQPTFRNILAKIDSIHQKYIYLKVGLKQFITLPPNPYEME